MNNLLASSTLLNNPVLSNNLQVLNGVSFTQRLIPALILIGLTIGTVIFFFNLLIGGIMWINSGGDKAQTEAARSKITNALIGIVLLFSLWALLSLIGNFLGTNLTLFNLGDLKIK